MTSHGFGGVKLHSSALSAQDIIDVAKEISLIQPIVWAHVVNPVKSRVQPENIPYDIIFEFDELDSECYNNWHVGESDRHGALKAEIENKGAQKLNERTAGNDGHQAKADLWVIEDRHHKGL